MARDFMQRNIKTLIVVPENNTTMEPEIAALCPALAPIPVARVKRPARTLLLEDLPAYGAATLDAIEPFAGQQFDLIIYGCTAAGFLGGPEGNARMVEKLSERTRATVISTAGAVMDALRNEDVSSTAVVTPYLAPVNDGLRTYLGSSGIAVETLGSFYCKTTAELGSVTQEQVFDLALRTVTPRSEALFIACSQLPTLNAVAKLRVRLDIPVWSSIQATAWAAAAALTAQGLPVRLMDAADAA
jgi:maleate cis-trans isomerase